MATKKTPAKANETKKEFAPETDFRKMDAIIAKHLNKFQKELLDEAVKKGKMCPCCLAQRLSLHMNVLMSEIIGVAVPGFAACPKEK